MKQRILAGTSGYAYDEWQGVFYPHGLPRGRRLEYYAGVFTALEINATYYGTPGRESARRMVREAGGRLAFSVKAPGDMTHRGRTGHDVVGPFLDYLAPLRDAGVLAAVLLQFPNALHDTPASREQLWRAFAALDGLPIAVELRHASWDTGSADGFLRENAASRVAIDQPNMRGLSQPLRFVATGPLAYFRFHGRNAASWYAGEGPSGDARYRYRYSRGELQPWAPILREAAAEATTTLAFFNNHPDGNAVLDAMAFAEMCGIHITPPDSGDLFG